MQLSRPMPARRGANTSVTGRHALVIYDDLSKPRHAYRQNLIAARCPPGREALGDVLNVTAGCSKLRPKLNNRRAERSKKKPHPPSLPEGGELAHRVADNSRRKKAIYRRTSTTSSSRSDGQIYLESDLFTQIRPAVSVRCLGPARRWRAQHQGIEEDCWYALRLSSRNTGNSHAIRQL